MAVRTARPGQVRLSDLAETGAELWRSAPGIWRRMQAERRRSVLPAPYTPEPHRWHDRGIHAAWIGHSTVLLRIDGFTILTDPVFSLRAGIHLGLTTLGVKRMVEPALAIERLPRIDLILLSHAHMDHFDLPSLRALESRKTAVVTAHRTSDLLRVGRYGSVRELGWRAEAQIGPASIRAFEVNHWGARLRTDSYRGYNGYLIHIGRWRVLFAGDTADTRKLRGVAGPHRPDLAIMPIGAYDPWIRFHCTPEQAWRMAGEANAEHILPVHHSTFRLGREPVRRADEPPARGRGKPCGFDTAGRRRPGMPPGLRAATLDPHLVERDALPAQLATSRVLRVMRVELGQVVERQRVKARRFGCWLIDHHRQPHHLGAVAFDQLLQLGQLAAGAQDVVDQQDLFAGFCCSRYWRKRSPWHPSSRSPQ